MTKTGQRTKNTHISSNAARQRYASVACITAMRHSNLQPHIPSPWQPLPASATLRAPSSHAAVVRTEIQRKRNRYTHDAAPNENNSPALITHSNVHCVSENDTDVAHYNFNSHQPIFVIFATDDAERVCYQIVIFHPTSPNWCLCTTWGNMNAKIVSFQSCSIPRLDNDTAFGTCYRLRLLLGRKTVHCSVASQLAERSRLCAEQCEEVRHRSWTPAALSAGMTEKTQFPRFMFPHVVQRH